MWYEANNRLKIDLEVIRSNSDFEHDDSKINCLDNFDVFIAIIVGATNIVLICSFVRTHHVCDLGNWFSLPTFSMTNFCGPLEPISSLKPP